MHLKTQSLAGDLANECASLHVVLEEVPIPVQVEGLLAKVPSSRFGGTQEDKFTYPRG